MAAAVVAVTGVSVPAGAMAVPATPGVRAPAAVAAMAVPEASQEEKVRAAAVLGIVASDDLLILNDRDFVFQLWRRAKGPEVRTAAEDALDDTAPYLKCTLFIKDGIFPAAKRDQDNELREATEKRLAREAKTRAAATIGIVAVPELLELSDRDFVHAIWQRATGPRVKAAALEAFGRSAAEQKAFIEAGIVQAHRQDQQDAIDADETKTREEKARQAAEDARSRAAAVLGIVATREILVLSDQDFVRLVWNRSPAGTEINAAAQAALRSSDPAVWKAFIDTGVAAANQRDIANALRKQAEENRRAAREIQARAENSLVHPQLAEAARTALAGSDEQVETFLRVGQYQALTQSLRTTTPGRSGWYVQSGGGEAVVTGGLPGPDGSAPVANATWRIVAGLADPECASLESSTKPGHYLRPAGPRVELLPHDGTDGFKKAATWCARKGLTGSGVSLEASSLPGHYLRHLGAGLFVTDDSGENRDDRQCGFTANATWQIDAPDPSVTQPAARPLDPCLDPNTDGLDFDGDRKADLPGFDVSGDNLWISLNTSEIRRPSSGPGTHLDRGWRTVRDQKLADYDGDGKVDIVGRVGNELWLWRNNSTPGRPSYVRTGDKLVLDWRDVSKFALADFDGDQRTDILAYGPGGAVLTAYLNTNTDGRLSPPARAGVSPGWGTVTGQLLADYDGDGLTDILGRVGDELWMWRNTSSPGRPSVASGVILRNGWNRLTKIAPTDFDADGRVDIVGYDNNGDQLTVIPNTSSREKPSRGDKIALGGGWATVKDQMFFDYDGDGRPDVIGRVGKELRVWRNTSTIGHFSYVRDGVRIGKEWDGIGRFVLPGLRF